MTQSGEGADINGSVEVHVGGPVICKLICEKSSLPVIRKITVRIVANRQ